MAIENDPDVPQVTGLGNGAAFTFSFSPIVIYASSEMEVTLVAADGTETPLSEGTGANAYEVTPATFSAQGATGSVIYPEDQVTAIASGVSIVMRHVQKFQQKTDLKNQGTYFPETLETAVDKLVQLMIQMNFELSRSWRFPVSSPAGVSNEMPKLAGNVGKYLRVAVGELKVEWAAISVATAAASDLSPVDVSLTTPAAGTGADFSREDHVHAMPNVSATQRALGRNTAGAGDPEEVTVTQLLDWVGTPVQGHILYRNATAWVSLAPGTSGQLLRTLGAGANPGWLTVGNVIGKQSLWVPASAMQASATNGCSSLALVEIAVDQPNMHVRDFSGAASDQETAEFDIAMPKSWNLGTLTYQVWWAVSTAVTTSVVWRLQGVAVSNDEIIGVAHGTAIDITDTATNIANKLLVSAESAAVTLDGTPADDDLAFFRLLRNAGDGADDMTQDARLLGIKLFFTVDAGNDA